MPIDMSCVMVRVQWAAVQDVSRSMGVGRQMAETLFSISVPNEVVAFVRVTFTLGLGYERSGKLSLALDCVLGGCANQYKN